MTMPRLYLAGGIAHSADCEIAFAEACRTALRLGWEPVNPLLIPAWCGQKPYNCPDMGAGGQESDGHSWRCWIRNDLAELIRCDAIYAMPGWEVSHGARREVALAAEIGLRVLFEPGTYTGGVRRPAECELNVEGGSGL